MAGKYTISVRISTTAPAQLKVGHSGLTFGVINLPNTNGAWQTIKSTITLPALTYTGIHVVSGSFKFNWFSIDNCATPPPVLTRIELSPDNVQVQGGQAQQFIATGYDADNNSMPIDTLSWTVTGAGNAISGCRVVDSWYHTRCIFCNCQSRRPRRYSTDKCVQYQLYRQQQV